MDTGIRRSVERLQRQFPLPQRQRQLAPPWRKLHQQVLQSFIRDGRPLQPSDAQAIAVNVGAGSYHY